MSGFYNSDEVNEMIDDILEEDADEEMLRATVDPEFERKKRQRNHGPQKQIATA